MCCYNFETSGPHTFQAGVLNKFLSLYWYIYGVFSHKGRRRKIEKQLCFSTCSYYPELYFWMLRAAIQFVLFSRHSY